MKQNTLSRAVRGGALGLFVGTLPALCHLVHATWFGTSDPEWGRGASVIGALVLMIAFGIPGLLAGSLTGGLLGQRYTSRSLGLLVLLMTLGMVAGWVLGQQLENRFGFPDVTLFLAPLIGIATSILVWIPMRRSRSVPTTIGPATSTQL